MGRGHVLTRSVDLVEAAQKRAVRNSVRLRRKWNQLSFGQWTRSGRIPVAWRQASKEKDRDNTIRTKRHLRPRLQSGSSAELFDRPLVARLVYLHVER